MHARLEPDKPSAPVVQPKPVLLPRPKPARSVLRSLLPGLISGAANDDPCAVGTYAQAGAAFGFSFLWTAPFTFPMIAATVYLCSKLSMVTGKGIAGVIRDYYPRWLLYSLVLGVLVANIIEAGADIGAIAASLRLFLPVPVTGITVGITVLILAVQTWGSYQLLQKIFAVLALALFAYVGAAILARPHVLEFLGSTFIPKLHFSRAYLAMLVALIGTRLSPYLYFWQSSQTVEQERVIGRSKAASDAELRTTAWDVNAGMFFSNFIMYFVILSTAATLFRSGQTTVLTADQAAQALRPLAGNAASLLFALGIIGVGVLAVPVLTTGPAHALAEIFGWRFGLKKAPEGAPEFYAVIVLSTIVAVAIGLSGINPISALFWASVVMGLLAPPLMIIIMLAVNNPAIMGEHTNGKGLKALGWITTAAVTMAAGGLVWSWVR
ncbi:MAG TPA: Nramp family divalent metal transporter [Terriglobales bacterium]|nr:Nramp family divalent metal transporter [Terriglobales bacterium]